MCGSRAPPDTGTFRSGAGRGPPLVAGTRAEQGTCGSCRGRRRPLPDPRLSVDLPERYRAQFASAWPAGQCAAGWSPGRPHVPRIGTRRTAVSEAVGGAGTRVGCHGCCIDERPDQALLLAGKTAKGHYAWPWGRRLRLGRSVTRSVNVAHRSMGCEDTGGFRVPTSFDACGRGGFVVDQAAQRGAMTRGPHSWPPGDRVEPLANPTRP